MRECPAVRIMYVRWESRGLEINAFQTVDVHEQTRYVKHIRLFSYYTKLTMLAILYCLNLKTNQIHVIVIRYINFKTVPHDRFQFAMK